MTKFNYSEITFICNAIQQRIDSLQDKLKKAVLKCDKELLEFSIKENEKVLKTAKAILSETPNESPKLYYFKAMNDTIVDSAVCYSYEQADEIRTRLEQFYKAGVYIDEEA